MCVFCQPRCLIRSTSVGACQEEVESSKISISIILADGNGASKGAMLQEAALRISNGLWSGSFDSSLRPCNLF